MSHFIIFIIVSFLITTIQNNDSTEKQKPIPSWDERLTSHFNKSNISNYIYFDKNNSCIKNYNDDEITENSYYLFVIMNSILSEAYNQEVETLGYVGFCLPQHKPNNVETLLINYNYIWSMSKMENSSIVEIEELKKHNNIQHLPLGILLVCFIVFCVIVTLINLINQKKKNYSIEELEEFRKEREDDNENNINNDNDDDFNIINNVDEPPADIATKLIKKNDIAKNKNNKNLKLEVNKELGENFMDEFVRNPEFKKKIFDSFDIIENSKFLLELKKFKTKQISQLGPIEKEIFFMENIKFFSYLFLMFYSCLPILERAPIKNPKNFYNHKNIIIFYLIFNSDYLYDVLFYLQGFYNSYFYLYNSKNINLKYILLEIVYKISPFYLVQSILYFTLTNIHYLMKTNPLSVYFYEKELENCKCRNNSIYAMIANLFYGSGEQYFPYCLFHFWYVYAWGQYFIVCLFLLLCYIKNKSFFYVIFLLILIICFTIRLMVAGIFPVQITFFTLVEGNLNKVYRSPLKILSRAVPSLFGFLCGVIYYENKNKNYSILTKIRNNKLLLFSTIIVSIFIYSMQLLMSFNFISIQNTWFIADILWYFYRAFRQEIFVCGLVSIMIIVFYNNKIIDKTSCLFNNWVFLILKKLIFTMFLTMSIIARIYFYCVLEPIEFNTKNILNFIWIGFLICLGVSLILNLLFSVPFQRVNFAIKTHYLELMLKSENK